MQYDDWTPLYRQLLVNWNRAASGEQCRTLYEALKTFAPLVVQRAVDRAIAEEKHWPTAHDLRAHAHYVLAGMQAPSDACPTCHGALWVEAPPFSAHGVTYANVVRACPQCRVRAAS
jgi:hypothetical protein